MKNSLILYHAYSEHFELLTDEELGRLLRAVMIYDERGVVTELEGMAKMAFSFIKKDLDISREKYEAKCEKNRENGEKGGRGKRKETETEKSECKNEKPEKSERFFEKPQKADNENENDNDNDNDNGNGNGNKKTRARFVPPSVEEVRTYCRERKNNVDPQRFIDHYTSNGWKVGKNPMKDWKAAVRTWEQNEFEEGKRKKPPDKKPSKYDFEKFQRDSLLAVKNYKPRDLAADVGISDG